MSDSAVPGTSHQQQVWAIVPAAGIGQRMATDIPKQYLPCAGLPVLQRSLQRLLDVDRIAGVIVALHPQDEHWGTLTIDSDKPVHTLNGGAERYDSVRLALEYLQQNCTGGGDALALVHDAVRPCVSTRDIDRLIDQVMNTHSGAILATRARDTMKRGDDHDRVRQTVSREQLWHAQTPQLFPATDLLGALQRVLADGIEVTDEASAMELVGHPVALVEASDTNIKITRAADLALAEFYLSGETA